MFASAHEGNARSAARGDIAGTGIQGCVCVGLYDGMAPDKISFLFLGTASVEIERSGAALGCCRRFVKSPSTISNPVFTVSIDSLHHRRPPPHNPGPREPGGRYKRHE